jgi:hypothetical protein
MWSHRRSRRRRFEPEAMLRAYRADPRDEFVRDLSGRLAAERSRGRMAWSRLAFAGAASTLILGMVAATGAFTYAASGATSTYSAVKQIVVKHKLKVHVHKSSAAGQYPPAPTPPQQQVAGKSKVKSNVTGSAVASVSSARSLPFTGISLLVTVLLGSALLVLGLILRRRERTDS